MGVSERCIMTWDKSKARWKKLHHGKWYRVTCTDLDCEPTKEDSYRAANEWWRRKQAELDRHPHAGAMEMLDTRIDWAKGHGMPEEAASLAETKQMLREDREGDLPSLMFVTPTEAVSHVWNDRLSRRQPAPPDRTLQALSARFLELSEARMTTGDLSASELDTARRCVGHVVDFFGDSNDPGIITPERWEDFWKHLLKQVSEGKQSREYVRKDWRYGKSFIRWMASMGKMMMPANLEERRYKFGGASTVIETFSVDEVRKLVGAAPGQLKLHLLLMLNAGMYQGDISDLRQDEAAWERGYITRQRSKTRHHGAKTPTVSYKLWPVTFDLLRKYRSDHAEWVLTTRTGKQWVEPKMVGSTFKRRDGIKSNFAHLQRRLEINKPLKLFRKTSATLLDKHKEYGRYAPFFLGHAGRSIAERHYVVPDQSQFDEAVDWLRQRYGL